MSRLHVVRSSGYDQTHCLCGPRPYRLPAGDVWVYDSDLPLPPIGPNGRPPMCEACAEKLGADESTPVRLQEGE